MYEQTPHLQKLRQAYQPSLPLILQDLKRGVFTKVSRTAPARDKKQLQSLFPYTLGQPLVQGKSASEEASFSPLRVGVVFSGGQAPGGHDVIAGLFDALKTLNKESRLFGFLQGASGIIEAQYREITREGIAPYRSQGGFDLIGSGRTKLETEEQLQKVLETVKRLRLNGLVIIGGDDSNTNAALLAEYFLEKRCATCVVGVPKTIDGDLKNGYIATSFGFDTACKVYSEMISNIARDALSARKYYHFIKLMGRSASHVTLECALATCPNVALIGEEIFSQKKTLAQIVQELADTICTRAENGKDYGVVLIPEGLLEFIPDIAALIKELQGIELRGSSKKAALEKLSPSALTSFYSLPEKIQKQLFLEKDPHGNIPLSFLETEKLLMEMVAKELSLRAQKGHYTGKFQPVGHFLGYEGRASFPSHFDTQYSYALGHTAALLLSHKLTGYMSCIGQLKQPVSEWTIGGVPLTMLMHMEVRHARHKPVIQKALVDLSGKAFTYFEKQRGVWAKEDCYRFTGPIQYFGPSSITESIPITMQLE